MSYKIVFLDIDGTILPRNHEIQESTKVAIQELQAKGIHVVIATGRPLIYTVDIADELGINNIITFNGAYARHQGKELFSKEMDKAFIQHALSTAKQQKHNLTLQTIKRNYIAHYSDEPLPEFLFNNLHPPLKFEEFKTSETILGATLFLPYHTNSSPYSQGNEYSFSPWTSHYEFSIFDVTSKSVNKGTAIEDYLKLLGISSEEAVAFGDGMNDVEMLSYVGMGVAMGNAQPGLLPYSNMQTSSVENDGIYNGLKVLGLL